MTIIGIDPGTATIGFGAVKRKRDGSLKCLGFGTIETNPSKKPEERLQRLNNELSKLIKKYKADLLATEKVFFFKNKKTAISVSQAQGVILLTAAKNKIPVLELAPLEVKMAITGMGRAEKELVQKRIKRKLKLKEIPRPDDAADALAVAICSATKIKKQGSILTS